MTREEIIKLNEYFHTNKMVQRYDDIKIYVNNRRTYFLMKMEPEIMEYLNLLPQKLIYFANLKIDG